MTRRYHGDRPERSRRRARKETRRGRRFRLPVVSLLLGLVVWFAPQIVAHSGLTNRLLERALPELKGQLTVRSTTLGWLSPVELQDVQLQPAHDDPLLRVTRIRTQNTLLALLADRRNIGNVYLDQPHLRVVLRTDGSNVEDLAKRLLDQWQSQPASPPVRFRVELSGGTVEVSQAQGDKQSTIEDVSLSIEGLGTKSSDLQLDASAVIRDPQQPGKLSAKLSWTSAASEPSAGFGQGQLQLTLAAVPIASLESVLYRCGIAGRVSGRAEADMQCSWDSSPRQPSLSLGGEVSVAELQCDVPSWFGQDQLRAESFAAKTQLSVSGQQLQVDQLAVDCDLGHVDVTGSADMADLARADWQRLLRHPSGPDGYQVAGQLDLARLATMLPATLRLRDAVQLTAGDVKFDLAGSQQQGEVTLRGSVQTSRLAGRRDGQPISWDQPLQLSVTVRETPDGILLDRLDCQSDVLLLSAQARLSGGNVSLQGDLSRLATELGKFFDLRGVQLAGRMHATTKWQYGKQRVANTETQLTLEDFQLSSSGDQSWREKQLTISVSASAAVGDKPGPDIHTGQLQLISGGDQLYATLTGPVSWPWTQQDWPLSFRLQGQLSSWSARIQPWCSLSPWRLQGRVQANGDAVLGLNRWQVEKSNIELKNLVAHGDGLTINEPLVRMEASGTWDRQQGLLVSDATTLASSALAFRASQLRAQPSTGAAAGQFGFRADLARLSGWMLDPETPSRYQLAGSVLGQVTLAHEDDGVSFDGHVDVQPLQLSRRHPGPREAAPRGSRSPNYLRPLWQERHVSLDGAGHYKPAADRLQLNNVTMATDAVRIATSGYVDGPTSRMVVNLQGKTEYDLAKLTARLKGHLGDQIQVTGQGSGPFSVQGPVSLAGLVGPSAAAQLKGGPLARLTASRHPANVASDRLLARAQFGWQSANVYGLAVGPNQFSVQLQDGVVNSSPWKLTLSGGQVTFAPRLELKTMPPAVVVSPGPLADNVRITPEMCRTWLKYVAPLLADATQAEGRLSITLSGARVPLTAPRSATVAGTLNIQQGQVVPGPLAKQLLTIARQLDTIVQRGGSGARILDPNAVWMQMVPQQINFQMARGRVHHQGLEVHVGEVVIRTQGSVGLDQSLSLVAEVPIRDQWVERDRWLVGLRGQSLRIPISGTLGRPRVDGSALERVTKQLVGNAAQQVLEDQLQKQLRKLFQP